MENEIIHNTKLIKDLSKSINYWSDKNLEYMSAYTHLLHLFTRPKTEEVDAEQEKTEQ